MKGESQFAIISVFEYVKMKSGTRLSLSTQNEIDHRQIHWIRVKTVSAPSTLILPIEITITCGLIELNKSLASKELFSIPMGTLTEEFTVN